MVKQKGYPFIYKETLQDIINRYNELTEQINILEEDLLPYKCELEYRPSHTPKDVEDALILYSKESTLYYEHKLSDGYIKTLLNKFFLFYRYIF